MEEVKPQLIDSTDVNLAESNVKIARLQTASGIKRTITKLTRKQERAALLVAADELTDVEIAKKVKISPSCLTLWKGTHPLFRARVKELHDKWRHEQEDVFLTEGLARRGFRLQNLNDLRDRIMTVIAERASDPDMQDVKGGKTGIIIRRYKGVGQGPAAKVVEEFEIDIPAIRELRALQRDAAEELGQIQPKNTMPIITNEAGSAPIFQVAFVESANGNGSSV